jgi:hypothetical protein
MRRRVSIRPITGSRSAGFSAIARLRGAAFLACLLQLAGCASGGQPTTFATLRTAPAQSAFALPPPGGPGIVDVIERRYSNATQQDIALSTSSNVSGQNLLRVQLFGPVNHREAGQSRLSERSLANTNISSEFRSRFPGVRMRQSPYYVQNRYGPFGYALGRAQSGDTCLYAWQRIRPTGQTTLITNQGTISLRLRLCDRALSEYQLLSVMYGITINAFFNDITWNPYGAPPSPPDSLGQPGTPMLPNAGSEFVNLLPAQTTRKARQPRPRQSARQIVEEAPPLPEPVGPLVPPPPANPPAGAQVPAPTPTVANPGPVAPDPLVVPPPPCVPKNGIAQCN